ncbi:MAG: diguanylate cyclase [Thermodesulfobacteriota bacterium]
MSKILISNRGFFDFILDVEVLRALRYSYLLTLMTVTHDPVASELQSELLHKLGELLLREVRSTDFVAQGEGGVFYVILPFAGLAEAKKAVERLLVRAREHAFIVKDTRVQTTLSVGCARFPTDASDSRELLQKSEEMLEKARREGGNRVSLPETG